MQNHAVGAVLRPKPYSIEYKNVNQLGIMNIVTTGKAWCLCSILLMVFIMLPSNLIGNTLPNHKCEQTGHNEYSNYW